MLGVDDGDREDFEIGVQGAFRGGGVGVEEVDAGGGVEASAGDGHGEGLAGVVGVGVEALDPEGGGCENFGGSQAGGALAVCERSGREDGGSGVVVAGGGAGGAGGVEALEAFGAVLVAAEDGGGADGGSVSFSAGEEGLQKTDDFFGACHERRPRWTLTPWPPLPHALTPSRERGNRSRTDTDSHGLTWTDTDRTFFTGVAPGCRWLGFAASEIVTSAPGGG